MGSQNLLNLLVFLIRVTSKKFIVSLFLSKEVFFLYFLIYYFHKLLAIPGAMSLTVELCMGQILCGFEIHND